MVGFSFILEAGAVSLAAGSEASCYPELTGRHHSAPSKWLEGLAQLATASAGFEGTACLLSSLWLPRIEWFSLAYDAHLPQALKLPVTLN